MWYNMVVGCMCVLVIVIIIDTKELEVYACLHYFKKLF